MATVQGLARLNAKLSRMPPRARQLMRDALIRNADELVRQQRGLAHRFRRTGTLEDSIHRRDGQHDLQQQVVAGGGKAFYARFVEFGTVRESAQPFFFAPYRTLKKKFLSRVRSATSKAVREVAGGR